MAKPKRKRSTETRWKFLSDEWFAKLDELIAAAGDLEIAESIRATTINITVRGTSTTKVHFKDGRYQRGHDTACATLLTIPEAIARKLFVDGQASAAAQAFFEGKLSIEGDVTALLALHTVEPSIQQLRLARQIQAITA